MLTALVNCTVLAHFLCTLSHVSFRANTWLCFSGSGGGEQGGLGLRSGSGAAGHGPLQHPGHPALLESGRAFPPTVPGPGRPAARLLPGMDSKEGRRDAINRSVPMWWLLTLCLS